MQGVFLLKYEFDRSFKVSDSKLTIKQQQEKYNRPGGAYGYVHTQEVHFIYDYPLFF